jgi:hypothetical protein
MEESVGVRPASTPAQLEVPDPLGQPARATPRRPPAKDRLRQVRDRIRAIDRVLEDCKSFDDAPRHPLIRLKSLYHEQDVAALELQGEEVGRP